MHLLTRHNEAEDQWHKYQNEEEEKWLTPDMPAIMMYRVTC